MTSCQCSQLACAEVLASGHPVHTAIRARAQEPPLPSGNMSDAAIWGRGAAPQGKVLCSQSVATASPQVLGHAPQI